MQKYLKIVFFLFILYCFSGCISTNYYKTGKDFSPLAENSVIAVFTSSKPDQKFEEIGLLRVRGGNLDKRIEEAKIFARKKGGNGLLAREIGIITEPGTEKVVDQIKRSTYETQEFVIIKFDAGKSIAKIDKLVEAKEDIKLEKNNVDIAISDKSNSTDYKTIPRASYNQLIKNYSTLQGTLFRGTFYPKKIYKIPQSLKPYSKNDDRLVLLTSKSGKNNIYLIIDKNNIAAFRKKIKAKSVTDFIYSPISVFKSSAGTHPVINFVEEIIEVK